MYRSLAAVFALGLISGQALAQEREWSLDASEQEAYLIFGVADSDDVGVSLWCPAKKGIVNLYVPRPTPELQRHGRRKLPMTVSAGGETATFAGKVDIVANSPTSSIEVEIPVDSPLLKALEKADRFSVTVNSEQVVFPLYDADVTALLGLCRKS